MDVVGKLLRCPAWFVLPAVLVIGAMATAAEGYTPLEFDPSLYPAPAQQVVAAELPIVEVDEEAREGGTPAPEGVSSSTSAVATGVLADGTESATRMIGRRTTWPSTSSCETAR